MHVARKIIRDTIRELAARRLANLRSTPMYLDRESRSSNGGGELASLREQNTRLVRERNHYQDECLRHLTRIAELERRLKEATK